MFPGINQLLDIRIEIIEQVLQTIYISLTDRWQL